MFRIAYVNGRYCTYLESLIHIEDRGYQFSDGIYEVWSVINRILADKSGHFRRLFLSLEKINLTAPMSERAMELVILSLIRKNRIKNGMVYLQITRGVFPRDHKFPNRKISPSITITVKPFPASRFNPDQMPRLRVITKEDLRWKRCDIKSVSLLANVLAKEAANKQKADECWLLDQDQNITEGSSTTAWIVKNSIIKTRPLSNDILAGITRAKLIELIKEQNLNFNETAFTLKEAEQADEAFLSSATYGVAAIISINKTILNDQRAGKITMQLRKLYFNRFR